MNIDVDKIEEKISKKLKQYCQFIGLVGHEMDKIKSISKKYNIYIIEDACHSIKQIKNQLAL